MLGSRTCFVVLENIDRRPGQVKAGAKASQEVSATPSATPAPCKRFSDQVRAAAEQERASQPGAAVSFRPSALNMAGVCLVAGAVKHCRAKGGAAVFDPVHLGLIRGVLAAFNTQKPVYVCLTVC